MTPNGVIFLFFLLFVHAIMLYVRQVSAGFEQIVSFEAS